MGNEEGQANTETGLHILTAMKAVATEHDGTRPVSIAPNPRDRRRWPRRVRRHLGYNDMDPQAAAYHKEIHKPVIGTETVSAVGTRHLRYRLRQGLRLAPTIPTPPPAAPPPKAGGVSAVPRSGSPAVFRLQTRFGQIRPDF